MVLPLNRIAEAESDVVVRVRRIVVVAIGTTQVRCVVVPVAAPFHTVGPTSDDYPEKIFLRSSPV